MIHYVIISLIATLSMAVGPITSFAGDRIGNGADALICDNTELGPRLLDLFERDERYFFEQSPMDQISSNPIEHLNIILEKRLKPVDYNRYIKLKTWLDSFNSEVKYVNKSRFIDIQDTGAIFLPFNCELQQLIVQIQPEFVGSPRYLVNNDLFQMLSVEHRAAAICHELLYRELIPKNPETSYPVRVFVALLFSNKIESMTQEEYDLFLKRIGFEKISDN
jgi:hypothetical protein